MNTIKADTSFSSLVFFVCVCLCVYVVNMFNRHSTDVDE